MFTRRYLKPQEILLPQAYKTTGEFVKKKAEKDFFTGLKQGDIIYAERKLNGKDENIYRSLKDYSTFDQYLIDLHTAVYVGTVDKYFKAKLPIEVQINQGFQYIWHATAVEQGTCLWSTAEFKKYYHPIAAKRFKWYLLI